MKKLEKASVGCRIPIAKISEVDTAAEKEGLNRAEWIELAIDRMLGKRPRRTLLSRLAKIEQRMNALESDRTA